MRFYRMTVRFVFHLVPWFHPISVDISLQVVRLGR